ncbi:MULTISPECIES: hypothetical protein [Paenibacillus]|uniref:hypothetical protein n=1 Tax=Paenibacillus TaxID=44249 RepID=UPI00096CA4B8|nr:hypothetical protein [Paenibacillus odorifer]OME11116.1 hypothetical protein BSK60_22145 [Paenibacillus odorifer]
MHESDWLPKVLLKSELIHICNILSLSEDGFRLASLPSRPVMNIRNVVSNALKLGIGRKKRRNAAIPINVFYEDIAMDVTRGRSDLNHDDFYTLLPRIMMDSSLRPYQRLAVLYDRNREFYTMHYNQIVQNAQAKVDWFLGVYQVDETAIVKLMISETTYPTLGQYERFVEEKGFELNYLEIKEVLKGKPDNISKIEYVNTLSGNRRFLGQLALLPDIKELGSVVFSYYANIRIAESNDDVSNELIDQLQTQLREENSKRMELENFHQLWNELLPRSNKVIIVTETIDQRICKLFEGMIVPKAYIYEKRKENIDEIKETIWMIDRNCFTNTKEWMELRLFFTNNDISFEEFHDDIILIQECARILQDRVMEEKLCY